VRELAAAAAGLKQAEQAATSVLHAGRIAQEKLDAQARAATALQALLEREPEMQRRRGTLDAARRADGLRDLHQRLSADRARLEALERGMLDAETSRTEAAVAHEQALQRLRVEDSGEPQRQALRVELNRLDQLQVRVLRLAEAREQHRRQAALAATAARHAEMSTAGATERRGALASAQARRERLMPIAAAAEGLAASVRELAQRREDRRTLDGALARARTAETDRIGQAEALAEADRQLEAARGQRDRLQRLWNVGQAQVLAAGLRDGVPCPVCGATDHPSPAHVATEVPHEQDLKAAGERVAAAEMAREQARESLAAIEQQYAGVRVEIQDLETRLGAGRDDPVDRLGAALEARRAELATAEAAATELSGAAAAITELERKAVAADADADQARASHAESERALTVAATTLAECEREVPEALRAPGALGRASDETRGRLAAAEESHCLAREAEGSSRSALAAAEADLKGRGQQLAMARQELRQAEGHWAERRTAAGFTDDAAFAAALLDAETRDRIARTLEDFDQALQAARTTDANARTAAEGIVPPDLAALEQATARAREVRESGERELVATEQRQERLASLNQDVARVARELAAREAEYGVTGRLAEVANSRNPQRLSFQRFVLAALLDDVLVAASQRLQAMSRGRYRLERRRDLDDRRGLAGLDLMVEDGYTGKLRAVETLSGGEGFQAALSLALGLAEVVQAYAGGMRLDTIFIDEGFGSLDPEALDLAVSTLIDLQQGGRLVGIISHVPELKERIDVRLEVTPTRAGSRARFVLP
jgi:exonuclease SbcC